VEAPKVFTGIRLDADIVAAFKATGRGWQTRMNAALRDRLKNRSWPWFAWNGTFCCKKTTKRPPSLGKSLPFACPWDKAMGTIAPTSQFPRSKAGGKLCCGNRSMRAIATHRTFKQRGDS
jgi:hypothetical protein